MWIATYTPEQYSAFWSAVAAIATLLAAAVAIGTLLSLMRDSANRSRPVMSAHLRPAVLSKGISELVIENLGQSVAKDVRVTFNPPLPDLNEAEARGKITPYLRRRYLRAIPTMPPGLQLSNTYSIGLPGPNGILENTEPVPDEVTITFDYSDARGKQYSDVYNLTINTLMNATGSYPSNTDEAGMNRRLVQALEAIARGVGRH